MRFLLFMMLISALHGVEVEFKPSSDINITKKEITALKEIYAEHGIDDLNIKKISKHVVENRILSNRYLKETPLSNKLKVSIQHKVEQILAVEMLKKIENEVFIDESIAKSYYTVHKNSYKSEARYSYIHYLFPSYKEALAFYNTYKDKANSISVGKEIETLPNMNTPEHLAYYSVQKVDKNSSFPLLLPPQFTKDSYSVIYVKSISESKFLPYSIVEKSIKNKLFNQEFKRLRDKTLEKMGHQ